MFEKALSLIEKYDTIIIHRHTYPDGDALGSQIGLKHILFANYPHKTIYVVGDDAKRYSFMDDCIMDTVPDDAYDGALAIILDTSSSALISDGRYCLAAERLRIDHHIFCEKIAETEVVDTSYESCCGLIAAFAFESNLSIPPIAAKALYTGMVTDSGRFRYDSTNARTFYTAAALLEKGVDLSEVYGKLYSDDFEAIKLRASYVLKIGFTKNNVAYIYTTEQELAALKANANNISRGMVGTMSDIKGVDIWVNFTESDGKVLCEIRSSKYNINPIAVKYGGGGHQKASGASLNDKEEAMRLLNDLDKLTEEQQ